MSKTWLVCKYAGDTSKLREQLYVSILCKKLNQKKYLIKNINDIILVYIMSTKKKNSTITKNYSGSKTSRPNKKITKSKKEIDILPEEEDLSDIEITKSKKPITKKKKIVDLSETDENDIDVKEESDIEINDNDISMNQDLELWGPLPVKNFMKKYEVSNKGSIRNIETGKKKKLQVKNGYYYCVVSNSGKSKTYRVHRLVAALFIKNPDKKNTIVNHIDGNKLNNNCSNLEWTTIKGNNQHAVDNNLIGKTKRRIACYDLQGNLIKIYESTIAASEATNCSTGNIVDVCKGKLNRAKQFKFKYADVNPNEQIIDPKELGMKNIKTFPNYWVSKDGRIYTTRGKKYLNPFGHPTGCMQIQLTRPKEGGGQIKKTILMHVLVAKYFLPKPKNGNYNCIKHKDGNKTNNKIENLEWGYVGGANIDLNF
jgi:hypothetical protein